MSGLKQRILILLFSLVIAFTVRQYRKHISALPIPNFKVDTYWGPGEFADDDRTIKPFKVDFSLANIHRLRAKLDISGMVEPLEDTNFEYGVNSKFLREFVQYWNSTYLANFDKRLEFINSKPHFKTQIQGLNIHFVHIKPNAVGSGKKVLPVLLLHGWPGSFLEFYRFSDYLTAFELEDIAFEVVIPSLPGYGFSDASAKQGLSQAQAAIILRNLMLRLGHDKFYVQGGDWGSVTGKILTTLFPENVVGFHSNWLSISTPLSFIKSCIASVVPSWFVPDASHYGLFFPMLERFFFIIGESGYFHLQATKPDTIGAVLGSSPAGLAAYIIEKFSTWTNPENRNRADGGILNDEYMDELLDNIMVYYMTNSITSSVRFYKEFFGDKLMANLDRVPVSIPTGCSRFRYEAFHQVDWVLKEKFSNLVHSTYHDFGGHFAAFEQPRELFYDFIGFVEKVEGIEGQINLQKWFEQ